MGALLRGFRFADDGELPAADFSQIVGQFLRRRPLGEDRIGGQHDGDRGLAVLSDGHGLAGNRRQRGRAA